MDRIIPSLRRQGVMFAEHYIGDRLPAEHEVFAFDALLDSMDLSEVLDSYSSEGGKVYAPRDMIAILLYAYSKGITSSYKISEEIRTNLVFIYLAGGQKIKRRTLCDFRKRNAGSLKRLLSSTVQDAATTGLLHEDDIFAIDGSKFSADASKSKTRTKAEHEARRKKIDKSVSDFFDELERNDATEDGLEEAQAAKNEEVMRKIKELKEQKSKSRQETKEINRIERQVLEARKITAVLEAHPNLKSDERINLTEPESKLMKNGNGEYLQGFNAQIITSRQIICAADLVQSENDQSQLQPMITALEKELPENHEYTILGDAGYNKGGNLRWIDDKKNIDAYISMNDRKEDAKPDLEKAVGRRAFEYDEDQDHFICPTGKFLDFQRTGTSNETEYAVYRADRNDCQRCDARHACLTTSADKKGGAKIIEDDGTLVFRNAMKEKMSLEKSKRIYAERAIEPEPVWGQIKKNLGIRRFRMRSFASMKGEFLLIAIASNLSKLCRHRLRVAIAAA